MVPALWDTQWEMELWFRLGHSEEMSLSDVMVKATLSFSLMAALLITFPDTQRSALYV